MQCLRLLEDRIRVDEPRSMKRITPDREVLVERRIRKSVQCRSGDDTSRHLLPPIGRIWFSDKLRPVEYPRMQVVHGAAQFERQSGLRLLDTRNLHALQRPAKESAGEIVLPVPDRQSIRARCDK